MSSSKPHTNVTTELAKQRNRAAAERTLLAWIRNSLTLFGLGITIDYISIELLQGFSDDNRGMTWQMPDSLSLLVILPGLALLALAIWQYRTSMSSIQRRSHASTPDQSILLGTTTAVVLFGIVSAIIILFRKA